MIENFLAQVYKDWVDKINSVHSIFTSYYGEERVDLQMAYTESDFIETVMNWDMRNMMLVSEDALLELNIHFAKIIQFYSEDSSRQIIVGNTTELEAAGLTEEIVLSLLQSIIGSEHECYLLNSGSFDFSDLKILVWFPEVTVTNDNDRSEVIYDVYIKIPISMEGTITGQFKLCRSTFTANQYRSGYMFSHTQSISNDRVPDFKECCLGNGPIRETISNLMGSFDEEFWLLFCVELESYLRVESLRGGPYIKLETIGSNSNSKKIEKEFPTSPQITIPAKHINRSVPNSQSMLIYNLINDFIEYTVQNKVLKFSYINGAYTIAHSYIDIRTTISNAFIAFINSINLENRVPVSTLYSRGILVKGIVKDGKIETTSIQDVYRPDSSSSFMPFRFKGERIPFVVRNMVALSTNESIFLSNNITHNILTHLLTYLNYGRNPNNSPIEGSYY